MIFVLSLSLLACGSSRDNGSNETASSEAEWVEVIKFEGKAIKDTETFQITSKEWRIVW